jgi:transcription termination factor Rho
MSGEYPARSVNRAELDSKHLAELHVLAAERGVPRYRLLRREELIEALAGEGGESPAQGAEVEQAAAEEPEVESPGAAEDEVEEPPAEEKRGGREEAAGEPVAGVLDVVSAGHGFLRLHGLEPDPDDVYISPSQIRRCELRAGDQVEGPARQPRRGERHPALVRVERVNGEEPGAERAAGFDQLTPVTPHRRIPLHLDTDDVLVRAVDLLAPLAFGQRVLVICAPRSGRTTLLRDLVRAISAAEDAPGVIVLLVDERPEEVTEWKRHAEGVEIAAAPADLDAEDQVRHAELALARAKRRAESGEDVVVIVDSLTRLGVAYRDPIAVKPVFGAGRELEEDGSGSLTMIATVLRDTEEDEGVLEAVETTENATIVLDSELAGAGVFPAIDAGHTGVAAEDQLRDDAEVQAARRLREELREADPRSAAEALAERIRSSASNAELLSSL